MENVPFMNEAVANIVKKLRAKMNFTQDQLAGFAKTSRSQIAQIEAGKRGITLTSLYWLADSFEMPFLDLIIMINDERKRLMQ